MKENKNLLTNCKDSSWTKRKKKAKIQEYQKGNGEGKENNTSQTACFSVPRRPS